MVPERLTNYRSLASENLDSLNQGNNLIRSALVDLVDLLTH